MQYKCLVQYKNLVLVQYKNFCFCSKISLNNNKLTQDKKEKIQNIKELWTPKGKFYSKTMILDI